MKYDFTRIVTLFVFIFLFCNISVAQLYWQQKVVYIINIDFDVKSHRFQGSQTLNYYNNSPDTLFNVYYHLYFNAFQPNSMMDVRSRTITDPDYRIMDRISKLTPEEIGFQRVLTLTQNDDALDFEVSETVLEVELKTPILPGDSCRFDMTFEAQVPVQIRRSGRNSYEGIDYSMAQWFPKMAEYDKLGWHAHPYVGREFFAPWGNYDVRITIDKDYVLAGTGVLQNPNEIGYGYEDEGVSVQRKGKTNTWHFIAENVHDFVWTADPGYTQTTAQVPGGPLLRFFYVEGEETQLWETLPEYTAKAFQYMEMTFGPYGWSEFSVIQGGDGGMEYPMATLIANKTPKGVRSLRSLVGVVVHEAFHSWYQGMLATNESYYAWMDEGFTSFAEDYTTAYVFEQDKGAPLASAYKSYYSWIKTGFEEPLSTHSDHFVLNKAYSIGSYTKGSISLEQLGYIIGKETLFAGLRRYRNEWAFRHPDLNDFIRVMEKQSGMELNWYYEYWINSTKTIDYGISAVKDMENGSQVTLARLNAIPMPLDVHITRKDGQEEIYYIPLSLMRGEKANETDLPRTLGKDWAWTHPEYTFTIKTPLSEIAKIEIDPTGRLADVNRSNQVYENRQEPSGSDSEVD